MLPYTVHEDHECSRGIMVVFLTRTEHGLERKGLPKVRLLSRVERTCLAVYWSHEGNADALHTYHIVSLIYHRNLHARQTTPKVIVLWGRQFWIALNRGNIQQYAVDEVRSWGTCFTRHLRKDISPGVVSRMDDGRTHHSDRSIETWLVSSWTYTLTSIISTGMAVVTMDIAIEWF